jgi:hypothetical protein
LRRALRSFQQDSGLQTSSRLDRSSLEELENVAPGPTVTHRKQVGGIALQAPPALALRSPLPSPATFRPQGDALTPLQGIFPPSERASDWLSPDEPSSFSQMTLTQRPTPEAPPPRTISAPMPTVMIQDLAPAPPPMQMAPLPPSTSLRPTTVQRATAQAPLPPPMASSPIFTTLQPARNLAPPSPPPLATPIFRAPPSLAAAPLPPAPIQPRQPIMVTPAPALLQPPAAPMPMSSPSVKDASAYAYTAPPPPPSGATCQLLALAPGFSEPTGVFSGGIEQLVGQTWRFTDDTSAEMELTFLPEGKVSGPSFAESLSWTRDGGIIWLVYETPLGGRSARMGQLAGQSSMQGRGESARTSTTTHWNWSAVRVR